MVQPLSAKHSPPAEASGRTRESPRREPTAHGFPQRQGVGSRVVLSEALLLLGGGPALSVRGGSRTPKSGPSLEAAWAWRCLSVQGFARSPYIHNTIIWYNVIKYNMI